MRHRAAPNGQDGKIDRLIEWPNYVVCKKCGLQQTTLYKVEGEYFCGGCKESRGKPDIINEINK